MFCNKTRIVVTGAAGTVGQELIAQLLEMSPGEVLAIDGREDGLFALDQKYGHDPRLQTFLADVRNEKQMDHLFSGTDYVFHAAALKHVYLCERMPDSSLSTNLNGVQNVIQASVKAGVKKFLFISSDKAVNPTNVMGATKLLGEKLVTAANSFRRTDRCPIFSSVRFGNVAGSSGSVIPLFHDRIRNGEDVPLTSPKMTRFFMTIREAGRFVIESMALARGGEVFVPKMPAISISELAESMVVNLGPLFGHEAVKVRETGPRIGEKMYEELMNEEEVRRSFESSSLVVILPALSQHQGADSSYGGDFKPVTHLCRSDQFPLLSQDELTRFLLSEGVLPRPTRLALEKRLQEVGLGEVIKGPAAPGAKPGLSGGPVLSN